MHARVDGVDGLVVIDKPGGMTSHDVVHRLRKLSGERSIGHLGTLDPMATGVLPLLMGKFTRLAQYFSSAEKSYSGTIRFGFATDTYDAEGVVVGDVVEPAFTLEQVCAAAVKYRGAIEQMPPQRRRLRPRRRRRPRWPLCPSLAVLRAVRHWAKA